MPVHDYGEFVYTLNASSGNANELAYVFIAVTVSHETFNVLSENS